MPCVNALGCGATMFPLPPYSRKLWKSLATAGTWHLRVACSAIVLGLRLWWVGVDMGWSTAVAELDPDADELLDGSFEAATMAGASPEVVFGGTAVPFDVEVLASLSCRRK